MNRSFNISAKFSSFFFLEEEEEEVEHLFPSFQDEEESLTHTLSMFCPNLLNFQRNREHSILSVEESLHFQYIWRKFAPILKKLRAFVALRILCLDSL
jgi:hypothetical protein